MNLKFSIYHNWANIQSVIKLVMLTMMMNCFSGNGRWTKDVKSHFRLEPLSEILTNANLRHIASRILSCTESFFEYRLFLMKLYCSYNHHIMAQLIGYTSHTKPKEPEVLIKYLKVTKFCQ